MSGQAREEKCEGKRVQHRVFYMAIPPSAFVSVSDGLKQFCTDGSGDRRIIVSLLYSSKEAVALLIKHRLRNHSDTTGIAQDSCR